MVENFHGKMFILNHEKVKILIFHYTRFYYNESILILSQISFEQITYRISNRNDSTQLDNIRMMELSINGSFLQKFGLLFLCGFTV